MISTLLLLSLLVADSPQSSTPADLDRILSGDFVSGKPAPSNTLHIVDWNIDRGEHLDQIAAVLDRDQADLCLLQEVDLDAHRSGGLNVAQELAKKLNMRYSLALAWQEMGQGDRERPAYQGQAILTRLPVHATRMIRFQEQSDFWKPRKWVPNSALFQRRLGGRIVIVDELEFGGRTLLVYNAHLESRSGGKIQDLQIDEILADAAKYPVDTPIILAGDFNTKYNAKALNARLAAAGWRSAFGGKTPRTHTIIFSLDWITVRGPIEVSDGKVEKGSQGSDHLPVSATISLKQ